MDQTPGSFIPAQQILNKSYQTLRIVMDGYVRTLFTEINPIISNFFWSDP